MDLRDAIIKLFSAGVLLAIIEFASIAIFTRLLSASAVGSFFLFQALSSIINIPSDLGIAKAGEKALSAGDDIGEVITTAVILKILLLLPWLLALGITRNYVDQYIGFNGAAVLVAIGLITLQGRHLAIRLLAGQMRIQRTALLRVVGKITWIGLGIGLILSGIGPEAIIISFIAGDLIIIAGGAFYLDLAFSWPNIQRARSLIDFGRYVFLRSIGSSIYSWMDVIILGFFVSQNLIGAYEIAWRVASLSLILTNAIRESIFPQISEWYSIGDINQISESYYRWLQPPLFLSIPSFFGALILGKEVLNVAFGANVIVAYPVLLIFMVEKILRSIHLLLSPALYAMEYPQLGYRGSVASLITNLILNIALIPFFGLIGAAVATTISSIVSTNVNGFYLFKILDIEIPWPQILWSLISATLMTFTLYLIKPMIPGGWHGLVISVLIGMILYFTFLISNNSIRNNIIKITQDAT